MLKNLIKGVLCVCIASMLTIGNCCGTPNNIDINKLVQDIARSPTNTEKLRCLVMSIKSSEGISKALEAFQSVKADTITDELSFERIACMVCAIERDICEEYGHRSVDDYLDGARIGKFGPFYY